MKKKIIGIVAAIFVVLIGLGIIGGLESRPNTANSSTETAVVNDTSNDIAGDSVQNEAETVESDGDAVKEIKEAHFSEYPSQPIGEAFDRFFENAQWTSSSTTVTFIGDYQDAEGKKTIGIQYELDSNTGRYRYSSMSIGGAIDKKGSNIASGIQYPQMMRAVFDEQEVPVVELSENDASDIKGMWIGKPIGQSMYSTEVIFIKDVNDDVIEFETAYCVANDDSDWIWKIARSDEGTGSLTSSDISGVKCFYADGETVYVDDGVLYYGNYGSDNMKMYKTSFRSLEEVIMYYRSDYDISSLRDNRDDTGFVIANSIKTYMDEFVEVIPSEYDIVDPEWYSKTNRFEYIDNYGFGHGVTFSITEDGLLGIMFQDWDENGEYFTTLPEQQNMMCYIDTSDYEVNSKNGLVYPLYVIDYEVSENYNYLTYYSRNIYDDGRIEFHIEDGMTPKYEVYYAVGLVEPDKIEIHRPEESEEDNGTLEQGSGNAEINLEPIEGESADSSWYKTYSNFKSADGTTLEIIYYDDGYFELAFDGLTADAMYSEHDFENEGNCLYYKTDEGIRFRYYPSKKMIEVVDAPYEGEYEYMD